MSDYSAYPLPGRSWAFKVLAGFMAGLMASIAVIAQAPSGLIDYVSQLRNKPFVGLSDTMIPVTYPNLNALCTSAALLGLPISINTALTGTKVNATTGSFSCSQSLQFNPGGSIQPASGQTVTLPPNIQCLQAQQCFDLSLSGASGLAFTAAPAYITPQNVGAKCDNSTDDKNPINYAFALGNAYQIPIVLMGCEYYVSGAVGVTTGSNVKVVVTGAGSAGGTAATIGTTIRSGDTSGAPVMEFSAATNGTAVSLSGFTIICSGSSSGDGLFLTSTQDPISGEIHDINVNGCKGTNKSGFHLSAAEGMTVGPNIWAVGNYNGMTIDTATNNNSFINLQLANNTNAGLVTNSSSGNHFSAPLFQSNTGYGCLLTAEDSSTYSSPWFEGNTINTCVLTNVSGDTFESVHHSYFPNAGMVINNTNGYPLGSSIFTGNLNGAGGVAVTISNSNAAGNVWLGSMSFSNFTGTGTSPFREIMLGGEWNGGLNNGAAFVPQNANQQTLTCGATCAIDMSASAYAYVTLTANTTVSFSSSPQYPTTSSAGGYSCLVIYDPSPGYSITWSGYLHGAGPGATGGNIGTGAHGFYGQCFYQVGSGNWFAVGPMSGPN